MTLASRKSGNQFKKPRHAKGDAVTPLQLAETMAFVGFPTAQAIAEGLATVFGGNGATGENPSGDLKAEDYLHSGHLGLWQEESGWGSADDRTSLIKSTELAYEHWKADGGFHQEWGQYDGEAYKGWKQYEAIAKQAGLNVKTGKGMNEGGPVGLVEDGVNAIENAGDFLTEVFSILTDYKRLGQLAAEGFSWFVRLLAKALWDYVAAPLWHWSERAVGWYWQNFFGVGTERGSGGGKIGPILRNNAGIITIVFWSVGYAVLWSDGDSISPATAQGSMLGQGIKAFDGTLARRNLIKPKDVKSKTPTKPKAKATAVSIDKTGEFSVNRKRPVSVGGSDGNLLNREGTDNDRAAGSKRSERVARPQAPRNTEGQTGRKDSKTGQPTPPPVQEKAASTNESGTGVDTRGDSGGRAKGTPSSSREKRD